MAMRDGCDGPSRNASQQEIPTGVATPIPQTRGQAVCALRIEHQEIQRSRRSIAMIRGASHICHLRGHIKSITRSLVHERSVMLARLRRTPRLDLPTSITNLLQVGMFVARWPLSAPIEGSVICVGAVHESQPHSAALNPRIGSPASVALIQELSQFRHSPAPRQFGRNAVHYGMGRRFARLACGRHQSRARDLRVVDPLPVLAYEQLHFRSSRSAVSEQSRNSHREFRPCDLGSLGHLHPASPIQTVRTTGHSLSPMTQSAETP